MIKKSNGFTVIELLLVTVLAITASIIFFIQKNDIETANRDNTRKTAINAMYYSLEEVFYQNNKYYPQTINSENLKSVDPELFTDPSGIKTGETGSEYTYEAKDCTDNKCKSYTLKADLEKEADYTKNSKNN